jgi:hypothetical protein
MKHELVSLSLWTAISVSAAFTVPTTLKRHIHPTVSNEPRPLILSRPMRLYASSPFSGETNAPNDIAEEKEFDKLLADTQLAKAVRYLQSHPDVSLSRERWNRVFDAIELRTAEAEEIAINTRKEQEQEVSLMSKTRMEMTDMYKTLKQQDHLRLFGAITKDNLPAGGGYTVRPDMLEQLTSLSMKALTPKPSNLLLYAGVAVAVLEGLASIAFGLNLNFLVFCTITLAIADRILVNGAVSESFLKILSPETQRKITRHEAGHFLCAYLLGCPVEGYVLTAWSALQDARFGTRSVNAGTSFFDPVLSSEIASSKISRSSVDRYTIIVMAGIAAEAMHYGQADGGAGDEMALIAFLSQLNGTGRTASSSAKNWNDNTIRNQARWAASQAVLLMKEYKVCHEALIDALERGGSLGDCIYAIEKAGRDNNLGPLAQPNGYILELPGGLEEKWVKELPDKANPPATVSAAVTTTPPKATVVDPEESLKTLQEYKQMMQAKLKDIDERLGKFE